MNIYLHPSGVKKELKNDYIGEVWTPWSNTIAYYPLTSATTVNDMSGNNYNLTNYNSNVTFWTYQWVSCASFPWSKNGLYKAWFNQLSNSDYTISVWAYRPSTLNQTDTYLLRIWWTTAVKWEDCLLAFNKLRLRFSFRWDDLDSDTNPEWQWTNIICQFKKSENQQLIYVNWVLKGSRTTAYTHNITDSNICLWNRYNQSYTGDNTWWWYLSEVIFENIAWNSTKIEHYYNLTKSNYWL